MSSSNNDSVPPVPIVQAQSKKSLHEFFQQKSVKSLVSVLVPGILAAALFPVLPAVATVAAAVAVKNALAALHISLSTETIEKILQPLEGKQIEESDVQEALKELLPADKKVNEETAKALVTMVPDVKEAALANPKLDQAWLGQSMEEGLQKMGGTMAILAPRVRDLTALDDEQLVAAIQELKMEWPRLVQSVSASESGKIRDIVQESQDQAEHITQQVTASGQGKIENVRQSHKQP